MTTRLIDQIPHRGKMHWLTFAEADADGVTTAEAVIGTDHPFVAGGRLLPAALIELMAQAAACGAAQQAAGQGQTVRGGVLAGVREMIVHGDVPAGATVTLTSRPERSFGALTQCVAAAAVGGRQVAEARLMFHVEQG